MTVQPQPEPNPELLDTIDAALARYLDTALDKRNEMADRGDVTSDIAQAVQRWYTVDADIIGADQPGPEPTPPDYTPQLSPAGDRLRQIARMLDLNAPDRLPIVDREAMHGIVMDLNRMALDFDRRDPSPPGMVSIDRELLHTFLHFIPDDQRSDDWREAHRVVAPDEEEPARVSEALQQRALRARLLRLEASLRAVLELLP